MNVEQLIAALEHEGWLVWSAGVMGSLHQDVHDWTVRIVCPNMHLRFSGQPGPVRGAYGDNNEVWRSYIGETLADALQIALDDIRPAPPAPDPKGFDINAALKF